MSRWSSNRQHGESPVFGPEPSDWYGVDAVDGDAGEWVETPIGSHYLYIDRTNGIVYPFEKRQAEARNDDWGAFGGVGVLQERVGIADFTDGSSATGTYTMKGTLPVGAFVTRVVYHDVTGFTGNSSATIDVGDGSTVDRFSATSPVSVFTTAAAIDGGVVSGTALVIVAVRPVLTVVGGSDFTAITAGAMTVKIFYSF